jgi:hypothetical protein
VTTGAFQGIEKKNILYGIQERKPTGDYKPKNVDFWS